MKGPPKPDKESPGDLIGPDFNGEVMFKIFCAIVFGLAITGIMMAVCDEANMVPECNPNQSSRMSDTMAVIRRGTTNIFIITPDRQDEDIQELRQQITDLQNRVYELENR